MNTSQITPATDTWRRWLYRYAIGSWAGGVGGAIFLVILISIQDAYFEDLSATVAQFIYIVSSCAVGWLITYRIMCRFRPSLGNRISAAKNLVIGLFSSLIIYPLVSTLLTFSEWIPSQIHDTVALHDLSHAWQFTLSLDLFAFLIGLTLSAWLIGAILEFGLQRD